MRICVVALATGDVHEAGPKFEPLSANHTIEYRYIHKYRAKQEIDELAKGKKYDIYFNFLCDRPTADINEFTESRYFDKLELPSVGLRSRKPNRPYVTAEEDTPLLWKNTLPGNRVNGDRDYICQVIQFFHGCLALIPFLIEEPVPDSQNPTKDPQTATVPKDETTAALYARIQKAAIKAFEVNCHDCDTGCAVRLRVKENLQIEALSVDSRLTSFLPGNTGGQGLPGGSGALPDIFVANYMLNNGEINDVTKGIANQYDLVAAEYDSTLPEKSSEFFKSSMRSFDWEGCIIELAAGTGFFGRVVRQAGTKLWGFDISLEMLKIARLCFKYEELYQEPMQTALTALGNYIDPKRVDHIVCFSALHHLLPEMFIFVMVLSFAIATKSVTFSIDEIPRQYNDYLRSVGKEEMMSWNHVSRMAAFGEIPGWQLVWTDRRYSWTSPCTGDDVWSTYYRFERVEGEPDLLFRTGTRLD